MHASHHAVTTLIGRQPEILRLDQAAARGGGQLVLVYGRRRIGKSYLLQAFSNRRPTIFYQATQQAEGAELAAFTRSVAAVIGSDYLPEGYAFPNWEAALDFLVERNHHPRLVAILDEFPYLTESSPGLPSVIQRWWDRSGQRSSIMLILCGSAQSFMADLDATAAPLHQRFTVKIHVGPLSYVDAGLFGRTLAPAERAAVYGVLGGTPLYLLQWDSDREFRDNLLALFGDAGSSLVDAAELVLSTDLHDASAPYRVLQAIALGKTRASEIRDYAKIAQERVLQRLIQLGFVERQTPATEDPQRTKRSIYRIADPYLAFYFRFIWRNRGTIGRGLGKGVVDSQIIPFFDDHMGGIFEDMAREYARELIRRGQLAGDDVGRWWSTDGQHEIDVVGTQTIKNPTFLGSVKWRSHPLDQRVLDDLVEDEQALGLKSKVPLLLIGRGGVDERIRKIPRVRGVSIHDLYSPGESKTS